MDESMEVDDLCVQVPGRRQQIQQLMTLFGKREQYVVPSVCIYGHTASGKSLVLKSVMTAMQLPYAEVNCIECYTTRLMYEQILSEVAGHTPSSDNEFQPYQRCDNMNDFVKNLKQIIEEKHPDQTVYIILDKAERLRDMNINILPAFLKLQELTGVNICVILTTDIVWEKFRSGTSLVEPYLIHFPDYSKDDLLEIMALDCPSEYPVAFYRNYVSLLLSVFSVVCRSLNELRHLALLNFPRYVEPIKKGEASVESTGKLWRHVEPHLKKALSTVYLREVSSAQWEKLQQEAMDAAASATGSSQTTTPVVSSRSNMELPFYSKYLLIAAYLASYNPATTDKRFFTKGSAKVGKRAQLASAKRNDRKSNQLLGPKPFPMDRLMAIFYAIVEGKVAPTANIFSQISSLVTLGLMAQIASADQLDSPKFKCLVSLEFIKAVSRTVNFEIIRHLYDFI